LFRFFSALDIADVSRFARSRTLGDEIALFIIPGIALLMDVFLLTKEGDNTPPIDTFAGLCDDKAVGIPGMGLRPSLSVPAWLDSLSEAIVIVCQQCGVCLES
jgi:hypothetical protein